MPVQWDVFTTWVRAHVGSQRGATLVEYALLVSLVALMCAGAISFMGDAAGSKLSTVAASIGQPT
jgi:pilus assembly protein Flp/PilA